jgi:hypothetical protein
MTYNIWNGGVGREASVLAVFQYVQPDVAVLQEVTKPELIETFARELGMEFAYWGPSRSTRGLALLSRLPVTTWQNHRPFPRSAAIS